MVVRDPSRYLTWAAAFFGAHVAAVVGVAHGLPPGIADAALVLAAAFPAVVAARAASSETGRRRTAWVLLAAALGTYALGEAAWTVTVLMTGAVPSFPGPPDVFFLAVYPLAAAGLVAYPSARRPFGRAALLLDGVLTASALLFVAWVVFLDPATWRAAPSATGLVALAYPVGDALLVAVALSAAVATGRVRRAELVVVALGFTVFGTADVFYAGLQATGAYVDASWLDTVWSAGVLLVGLGAVLASSPAAGTEREAPWASVLAPYVPVALAVAAAAANWQAVRLDREATAMGAVVALALFARQAFALADDRRTLREAEAARVRIAESEARLSRAQRIVGIGSFEWDVVDDRVVWSDELCRILGRKRSEAPRDRAGCEALVHPEDLAIADAAVAEVLRTRRTADAEYRVLRPDGTSCVLAVRFDVVDAPGGSVARLVGTVQDVTEKKRLAEEARLREVALQRQERLSALGTLVAGVAHEVNNPLFYIRGNLELALMDLDARGGKEPEVRALVEKALAGTERIERLVKALRVVARRGSEKVEDVDLDDVLRDLEALTRVALPSNVDAAFHPSGRHLTVSANAAEVHQVLLNLVRNALDALARGGRVDVYAREVDGFGEVRVVDDGPGVPPDLRGRLFTPFFTTKPNGTGLGLSIAYAMAHEHGGTLEYEAAPGGGSTFVLRLPRSSAARADAEALAG